MGVGGSGSILSVFGAHIQGGDCEKLADNFPASSEKRMFGP